MLRRIMSEETGEENFFDFKCPYCAAVNSFPENAAGRLRDCMNCMENFLVPEPSGEVARKVPLPITSANLVLRRAEPEDWKDFLEFLFADEDDFNHWLARDRKT